MSKKQMELTKEQSKLVEDNILAIMDIANKFMATKFDLMERKKLDRKDIEQIALEEACKIALNSEKLRDKFITYLYNTLQFEINRSVECYNIVKIPRRDNWNIDSHKDNLDTLKYISCGHIVELDKPREVGDAGTNDVTLADTLNDKDHKHFANDEVGLESAMRQEVLSEIVGEEIAEIFMLQAKGYRVDKLAKSMGLSSSQLNGRLFRARAKIRNSYDEYTLFEGISS